VHNNTTNDEEVQKRARQVLKWLAMPGNTKWLIIFDNVDQYSPIPEDNTREYDICEFFPKADHGSIIITTRLQSLADLGKSFSVQKLGKRDAIQLLLQSSGFSTQTIAKLRNEKGNLLGEIFDD
jgi:hypothetical protein